MVLCPRHQRPNFHCMHAACTLPWTEDGLSLWYQTTTAADHLISIAFNAGTHEAQHIKIIASLQNGRGELRWPCWSGASMTDYAMGPSVIPTPRLVAWRSPCPTFYYWILLCRRITTTTTQSCIPKAISSTCGVHL